MIECLHPFQSLKFELEWNDIMAYCNDCGKSMFCMHVSELDSEDD